MFQKCGRDGTIVRAELVEAGGRDELAGADPRASTMYLVCADVKVVAPTGGGIGGGEGVDGRTKPKLVEVHGASLAARLALRFEAVARSLRNLRSGDGKKA